MSKVLISWFDPGKDLINNNKINPNGPTISFYKNFYSHDFHILIVTEEFVEQALFFKKFIEDNFKNIFVITKPQQISFDETNYSTVKAIEENIFQELKGYTIDILLNTGSELMRTTWFITSYSSAKPVSILEIRKFENSSPEKTPQLVNINFEISQIPLTALIREYYLIENPKDDKILTASYQKIYDLAYKIAHAENIPILLIGGKGSGKESLAQFIHQSSPIRSKRQFVSFDCAAYPEELILHKLFGYKKGTFPGATHDYKGVFGEANGGTAYLKNIDALSPRMQKLIKNFIENPTLEPIVGRNKKVNVRIIASTTHNVSDLIKNNLIDLDLFYHFVARLVIPSFKDLNISEKREIIDKLININVQKFKVKNEPKLCSELLDFLFSYNFPGNFTELKTLIESFFVLQEKEEICIDAIPEYINLQNTPKSLLLTDVEKAHIEKVLKMFAGNKSRTARALGIALNTLKKKINDYNINIERITE